MISLLATCSCSCAYVQESGKGVDSTGESGGVSAMRNFGIEKFVDGVLVVLESLPWAYRS